MRINDRGDLCSRDFPDRTAAESAESNAMGMAARRPDECRPELAVKLNSAEVVTHALLNSPPGSLPTMLLCDSAGESL